jgi:hypothetical protein
MRLLTSLTKTYSGGNIHCFSSEGNENGFSHLSRANRRNMTNIKFVVRVSSGKRAPAYVQAVGKTPFQMTTNRKLALIMGKFTAEDAAKSIQNSRCTPEIVPVDVSA